MQFLSFFSHLHNCTILDKIGLKFQCTAWITVLVLTIDSIFARKKLYCNFSCIIRQFNSKFASLNFPCLQTISFKHWVPTFHMLSIWSILLSVKCGELHPFSFSVLINLGHICIFLWNIFKGFFTLIFVKRK